MSDTAKHLRKQVKVAKGPEDGSVITFESVANRGRKNETRYKYAAIFIRATGMWYLTSERSHFGANYFSHHDFMTGVLAKETVENVSVATAWEQV